MKLIKPLPECLKPTIRAIENQWRVTLAKG